MKSLWILLILLPLSANAFEQDRWNELYKMVQQEVKIIEKSKNRKPRLELRLVELYTEKLKLIQEKNNKEFLAAASSLPKNKAVYFQETKEQYQLTKDYGLSLLKADHPYRGQVALTLGLNSRDYSNSEVIEEMLTFALKTPAIDAQSRRLAQAALAEFYYNSMKYAEAIPHYEGATARKDDVWLAKHSYNLAWCYLKDKRFNQALSTMALALRYTNDEKYVKIPNETLASLSSFYTYVGKPLEAMQLYAREFKDPFPVLISLAAKTSERGQMKETMIVLAEAQKSILKSQNLVHQEELLNFYLDFYRANTRHADHARISAKLTTLYTKNPKLVFPFKEEVISKFRGMAGYLHLQLTKNMKENKASFNLQDLPLVISYYKQLEEIDLKRKPEYLYYEGETYYSVWKLPEAAVAYSGAVDEAVLQKNHIIAQKALDSILDLAATEKLPKDVNKKYLTQAYTTHVRLWPKSEKSKLIYPKLFEIFYQDGDDKRAAGVLTAYNMSFPGDLNLQQALITRVMNKFIDRKDTAKLSAWIGQFKKGFLCFDKDTIVKMEVALGSILFGEYQALAMKGQKLEAAKGFESIYNNDLYSAKVKGEAAFFAAMAYLDAGNTTESYNWNAKAMDVLEPASVLKHRPEQIKIVERTYRLQDFATAYKLAASSLARHCSLKDATQKRFYELSVMTSLVEEELKDSQQVIEKYSQCLPDDKTKQIALEQLYRATERKDDYSKLSSLVATFPSPKFNELFKETQQKWYWDGYHASSESSILKDWEQTNPKWSQEIKLMAEAKIRIQQMKSEIVWNAPAFDPEKFNAAIENHLKAYQDFKSKYQHLLQSSQSEIVIQASMSFADAYKNLGDKLTSLSPKGLDPQTLKEVKAAMLDLSKKFNSVSHQYLASGKKVMRSGLGLSETGRSIASIEGIENPVFSSSRSLPVDKGGK